MEARNLWKEKDGKVWSVLCKRMRRGIIVVHYICEEMWYGRIDGGNRLDYGREIEGEEEKRRRVFLLL